MPDHHLPLLIVVEGLHDAAFLKRISRLLHRHDPTLPNLAEQQHLQRLVFLPVGGNGPQAWFNRLASLGKREFYLFDREVPPESEVRRRAMQSLKQRRHREAFLTSKRSLENYLHPGAIEAVRGIGVAVDDEMFVAEEVAKKLFEAKRYRNAWKQLTLRAQKRLREQAKYQLNREAVDRMTVDWLEERDPTGEVPGWMRSIARLLEP